MFSPAVAVVDAELGILLSLTSYLGGRPVRRYELRNVAGPVSPGDFRVHLPPGLRLEQETDPLQGVRDATKAAGDFLHRMGLS
jgi:hypothetical protein